MKKNYINNIENNIRYKIMYYLDFSNCYIFSLVNRNNYNYFNKLKKEKQIENTNKNKKKLINALNKLLNSIKDFTEYYYLYYYHYSKTFFKRKDKTSRIINYYYNIYKNENINRKYK